MAFGAEETAHDREVAALKRAKQKTEEQLVSEQNERMQLQEELKEAKLEAKERAFQAQQEAAKAVKAEDALAKKTAAYNTLRDQKANAEMALREAEELIVEQKQEIKKLSYDLEISSVRTAESSDTVKKEKTALEKRVHQLTAELQRTQMELEKEKENAKPSAAPAPASKIARPPSRSSIAPADSQGRFGFRSGIPAPASSGIPKSTRPPSSLGQNGAAPTPSRPPSALGGSGIPSLKGPAQRRTSVSGASASSAAVNTSASSQKVQQLEADLGDAKSSIRHLEASLSSAETTISTLETSLSTTQTKLQAKSDELLRIENQLIALERSSKDEVAQLRSDLEDAQDEAEGAREELRDVRDELQRETDLLVKEAKAERTELERRVEAMRADVARMERERDEAEGSREELERLIEEGREDVDDLRADNEELENELAWAEETIQELEEKLAVEVEAREQVQADLEVCDQAVIDLEADNGSLSTRLEQLQQEKDALVKQLATAELASPAEASCADEAPSVEEAALRERVSELEERIAEVELERDDLAASLDEAKQQHATVQSRHDELAEQAGQGDVELAKLRQEMEELSTAHNTLRSDSTAAADAHHARVLAIEAQLAETTQGLAAKAALLATHEESALSRGAASEDLDRVTAERDALAAVRNEAEQQLAAATASLADLDSLRASSDSANEKVKELEAEVNQLVGDLQSADAEITRLQASLDEREESPTTQELDELKTSLATAEGEIVSLQEQLREAQAMESGADDASKVAEEEIVKLRQQLEALETAVEAEKGIALDAKQETTAIEEALFDMRHELQVTADQLDVERRGRQEATHECEILRAEIDDLEVSASRLAEVEDELAAVTAELDDVRAAAEDASFSALEEIAELQARLREQESVVDQLERHVFEVDALRRVLGETEGRVDSLGWELREARAAAAEKQEQVDVKVKALLERAEAAEAALDSLRAELDTAQARLSDAHDSLDQAQADLAASTSSPVAASPAPASPLPATPASARSFPFSPESDPSILITRLREERDELRQRLDFARTEARFRVDDLHSRLRDAEESKASELSALSMDLVDKHAAYETERETNVKIEQALRDAKREKERVQEELDGAARKLREAESRVEVAVKQLAEEQQRQQVEKTEADRESAWALEEELDAANKTADSARAELSAASAANEELSATLASLQDDLSAALREVEQQKAIATAAGERIAELEAAFSASKAEQERLQQEALADFASLCATLQTDVEGLNLRIAQQDATIEQYQRKIALLQLNLAVRVAIEDDEDLVDESSAVSEAELTVETVPREELLSLQGELDEAHLARAALQQQLSGVQSQLEAVQAQRVSLVDAATSTAHRLAELESAASAAGERVAHLEAQLSSSRDEEDRLATALEAEIKASSEQADTVASLQTRLEDAETRASEHEEQLVKATMELAGAQQAALEQRQRFETGESAREAQGSDAAEGRRVLQERVVELEAAHEAAKLELAGAHDQVSALTSRLTATTDDLSATKDILEATTASLAAFREQAQSETSREELEKTVAELHQQVERLQVDVEERTILQEQAQSRLRLVEEQLAATASDRDAAQDALAGAEHWSRSSRDEQQRLVDELAVVKDQAATDLATVREEMASLAAQLSSAGESSGRVLDLEQQLRAAQAHAQDVDSLLQQERDEAAHVKATLEEATEKAKAAAELSAREIQTLRRLSKSSQTEAEALTAKVSGLRQKVDELTTHIGEITNASQLRLQQLTDESRKNIEEVIGALEACETDKGAAEAQVRELEQQIKDLSASQGQSDGRAEERVAELEKMLEARMGDVEEADEKLIDALKAQKRYTTQIERLKAKIASLQRDLAAAKAAPPPVPAISVPLPSAPTPSSANKKRRAPTDFDAAAAPVPRAIVASTIPSALDQENAGAGAAPRRVARDAVVPLKPEHVPALTVKPLQPVDENAAAGLAVAAPAPAINKIDSLKARMKAQQMARREAASAPTA
ncbi:hypothetical protein JCM10207_008369 [Rhodosporidiobolus poonsookiae]